MGKFERSGRCGRIVHLVVLGAGSLLLAACNHTPNAKVSSASDTAQDVAEKPAARERTAKAVQRTHKADAAKPRAAQHSVYFSTVGVASWYGPGFHGRRTANGETFDMHSLTAAHPTLPLQSQVRVTNLANSRSLVVRVNDRGPYVGHRVIDVSAKTAQLLGFYDRGLAKVKVEVVGRASTPAVQASAR